MIHPLAGTKVKSESLIDVKALETAYYTLVPTAGVKGERVSFGTSGHRGKAEEKSFNDLHVAAIAQAICDGRQEFGANSLCFVGPDTHALSSCAYRTVLEVLAGNKVVAGIDANGDFVPTPSVSRAILRYNEQHEDVADGIIITPSHNPPNNGGIKYNPPHGGPADTTVTKWIEAKANQYIEAKGEGIKRTPFNSIDASLQIAYEFKKLYVEELPQIINIEAIKRAKSNILVDALGGSGAAYWEAIRDTYGLNLTVVHSDYDPTFSFMAYDHDGVVRMDCSSAYAMAEVIRDIGQYDLAVGNDPDYDRYGIVTQEGMLEANKFLVTAGSYLFETRQWAGKGFAKTVVVTNLVDRMAEDRGIPVYEVPVGFKFFSPLLFAGTVGIAGEESAGGSFLKMDGTVWTTDKDGMIMALLAMEILATTGATPAEYYKELVGRYGEPVFSRQDAACSKEEKEKIKSLTASAISTDELNGEKIIDVRTTSLYGAYPIDGLRITTKEGWVVARPSGTEDLYKIYGESFKGEDDLTALLNEGRKLVDESITASLLEND